MINFIMSLQFNLTDPTDLDFLKNSHNKKTVLQIHFSSKAFFRICILQFHI